MKNNRLFLIAFAALITVSLSGCFINIGGVKGDGNVISQERPVTGFDGLTLNGAANINIYPSDNYRLVITTDSNIQELIESSVTGSSLNVGQKNNVNFRPTKLVIEVYMPEIKNVTINGAGNIKVAAGRTSALEINMNGAGEIDAQAYEAQNVNVNLNGAGKITTWATSVLNYQISGAGTIRYNGAPSLNGNISGVGNIKPF